MTQHDLIIGIIKHVKSQLCTKKDYQIDTRYFENYSKSMMIFGGLFDKLNTLNLCFQGFEENIIIIAEKLKAFEGQQHLWLQKSKSLKLDFIPEIKFK